ncbi:hypothetical protein [Octadecabacter sp. R77987]|uniref:hypothetical protein n=1 Tax=Octadecabacter sp. R77987 TaxID=3093874 RepID=UPI003671A2A6
MKATMFAMGLALAPLATQAQTIVKECVFPTQCYSDGDCDPTSQPNYTFTLDLNSQTGLYENGTFSATGFLRESGALIHFYFVNSAGTEIMTFADNGAAEFVGHMSGGSGISTYTLTGTCTIGNP